MLKLKIELPSLPSTRTCQLNLNTCANLMLLKLCPRLRLKSNSGDQDTKLKAWEELMSLREEELSCRQELLKQKRMLMLCKLRLPMLRNPRLDLLLTLMKSQWNMSVSMLLPSSPKREERTLTRFLENGKPRPMMLQLKLKHPRMKDATTVLNFSD